jgi:hypothetical protein
LGAAAFLGELPMSEPIDRLCELIAAFDVEDSAQILYLMCAAVGCPEKPTGVAPTKDSLISELTYPYTADDLRKRLNLLIDRMEVWPVVLVTGILNMLTDHYDRLADPANVSKWIDHCLAERQALEAELGKSVDERATKLSDDSIRRKIKALGTIMTSQASGRQRAERLADRIREEWGQRFPIGYWYAWMMQHLRDTAPPWPPDFGAED